jgi:hypothetical protein
MAPRECAGQPDQPTSCRSRANTAGAAQPVTGNVRSLHLTAQRYTAGSIRKTASGFSSVSKQ